MCCPQADRRDGFVPAPILTALAIPLLAQMAPNLGWRIMHWRDPAACWEKGPSAGRDGLAPQEILGALVLPVTWMSRVMCMSQAMECWN